MDNSLSYLEQNHVILGAILFFHISTYSEIAIQISKKLVFENNMFQNLFFKTNMQQVSEFKEQIFKNIVFKINFFEI